MKPHGGLASLFVLGAFAVAASAAGADASAHARYRIELSDGSRWAAVGSPAVHGSILTFRTPNGTLMGVPREMIQRVESVGPAGVEEPMVRALEAAPAPGDVTAADGQETSSVEAMRPGDLVVLGPLTDRGQTLAESAAASAGSAGTGAAATGTPPGAMGFGGYGGSINPNLYVNPNGTLSRAPSSTNLALALATQTTDSNGFPLTSNGSPTVIGPDGTPTLAPGVPGSAVPAIGPNGTPVIGETGTATTFLPIGPNGTPVLAPAGQPGAQPVVIGSNGTPELAPSFASGSPPVVFGPNGTPVLAPSGQAGSSSAVIGANGTPVLAPGGQAGSAFVVIGPNGTPAAAAMRGAAPSAPAGARGPAGGRGR